MGCLPKFFSRLRSEPTKTEIRGDLTADFFPEHVNNEGNGVKEYDVIDVAWNKSKRELVLSGEVQYWN
jgi:hypothetical protein